MNGAANRPGIEAYIGASGSGKGVSINRRLAELKPPRLLIWDPRDEYGKHAQAAATLPDVVRAFSKAGPDGPARVRYTGNGPHRLALRDAFALCCRVAFEAGQVLFLAEELSDVTSPSYAPPAWRQLITQGRHRGARIIGAAQRPAMIDKAFLGSCTYVRCFTLRYPQDRAEMAAVLGVPADQVARLQTIEREGSVAISYIERDFRSGEATAGTLTIKRRA